MPPAGLDIKLATQIMQYTIGALMALVPVMVWGFIFYRKSPENKKTTVISLVAGALSVIPMFVWQYSWKWSFDIFGLKIPHLNIYSYVQTFSANPTLGNFFIFTMMTMVISFLMYVAAAGIILVADVLFGTHIKSALRNVFRRSLEEPLIFISTGLFIAFLIVWVSWIMSWFASPDPVYGLPNMVMGAFWTSMMIGFLEEYSKHLVVRFADDDAIYTIDSAIQFSLIVGLGFAFLENIIYFVDKIWLSPCVQKEIANNECLFNPTTKVYMHQVGVMLVPYIFRSILSTLAHLVFSGIFGYFYGIAHFASYELQEAEKKKWGMMFWGTLHKILGFKTTFVFHELKIMQGLIFAMVFHGLFDFVLDQEKTFLTVPMIFGGFLYLSYLFQKADNHRKLRLISESRTSLNKKMETTMNNIELLKKFEQTYQHQEEKKPATDALQELKKNVHLLEKYEEMNEKKNRSKKKED